MSRNVNIYKSSNGRQYVRVSESYRNADDDMLAAFGLKPLCRLEEKASLRRKLRLKTFPPMDGRPHFGSGLSIVHRFPLSHRVFHEYCPIRSVRRGYN